MRSIRLVAAGIAACGMFLLFGCPERIDEGDCKHACDKLGKCGLLPSSLGANVDDVSATNDCIDRCIETESARRAEIFECTNAAAANAAGICSDTCGSLAGCLIGNHPSDAVTGLASLRITPVAAGAVSDAGSADTCSLVKCPDDGGCPGTNGSGFIGNGPHDWCTRAQASTARAFVVRRAAFVGQRETYLYGPYTNCEQLLANGATFDRLLAGPTRVGIQLRGATAEDDGGADAGLTSLFCRVYYGEEIGLHAGTSVVAKVPLPDPGDPHAFTCEEGDSCSDNVDNDGNGFRDCGDENCHCDAGITASPDAGALEAGVYDADTTHDSSNGDAAADAASQSDQ